MKLPLLELSPVRTWQDAFSHRVQSVAALLDYVQVKTSSVNLPNAKDLQYFPLRVPMPYLEKIVKGNPLDPLLLQVLPTAAEFEPQPGFVQDPLEEARFNPVPGIIHKYKHRVLLVTTQACAIHCRYCFRRHFPYSENVIAGPHLDNALAYIAGDSEIDEVILSGGDPLSLTDDKLDNLLKRLAAIPHVQRLRIHTRLLALVPDRITVRLTAMLADLPQPVSVVLHINHPNEIDQHLHQKLSLLRQAGVHLFNQSVLLATINDCPQILKAMNLKLFECGILPYYLHLLDPVEGARHFDINQDRAKRIMRELLDILPGYLVPKLVCEQPGLGSKRHIDLSHA